jgi:hypothetical protein
MKEFAERILVTVAGECFAAELNDSGYAVHRSSHFGRFQLTDKVWGRGILRVAAYVPDEVHWKLQGASEPNDLTIMLNTIRRDFDAGKLSFEVDENGRREDRDVIVPCPYGLKAADDYTTNQRVRDFIRHKAYWEGFSLNPDPRRQPLDFSQPLDLDYLSVGPEEMKRNLWFFEQKGFLEVESGFEMVARPTAKLVESYSTKGRLETVLPGGTPYDSYKEIRRILDSAHDSLLIVDNYVDTTLLDMLKSVPPIVSIKVLTWKFRPGFSLAVKKFLEQSPGRLQVRRHGGQVHDRFVVVDDEHFYCIGQSVKDAGRKLGSLYKLQDSTEITKLRKLLTDHWNSAQPLEEV